MRASRKMIGLLAILVSVAAIAQKSATEWNEYNFPADGFAIKAPDAPKPHADANFSGATAYTVNLPKTDEAITLRVMHQPHDCDAYLRNMKDGFLAGKQPGADLTSFKNVSISGHPGVQYEWRANPTRAIQERYYCVNNQFYTFAIAHPGNRPLSHEATRILDSFRLTSQK